MSKSTKYVQQVLEDQSIPLFMKIDFVIKVLNELLKHEKDVDEAKEIKKMIGEYKRVKSKVI